MSGTPQLGCYIYGQGIVAKGKLNPDGIFVASEVLAKHDENYMPPEVADALEAAKTLKTE